jgi:hypothetical protein
LFAGDAWRTLLVSSFLKTDWWAFVRCREHIHSFFSIPLQLCKPKSFLLVSLLKSGSSTGTQESDAEPYFSLPHPLQGFQPALASLVSYYMGAALLVMPPAACMAATALFLAMYTANIDTFRNAKRAFQQGIALDESAAALATRASTQPPTAAA